MLDNTRGSGGDNAHADSSHGSSNFVAEEIDDEIPF